jgi:hypothetical protein
MNNYLKKLIQAAEGKQGLVFAHVLHDSWCDLLKGKGPCNCDPEVVMQDGKHEA